MRPGKIGSFGRTAEHMEPSKQVTLELMELETKEAQPGTFKQRAERGREREREREGERERESAPAKRRDK